VAPGDQPFSAYGILIGTSAMTIAEVKFDDAAPGQSALIKNIVVTSSSSIEEDALSGTMKMTIDTIDAMGLSFTDFVYDLTLNSLNVPALQKVNELANKMNAPQMTEQDMQALQDALLMLLQGQPEVVINNLGITTAQGDIKNRARVTIDSTLIDPNNPLSLLTALEMQAAGSIPKAFLESMGAMPMIQQYVTEGLVEIESDEVRYDMVFEDGQMLLFGKPYQWAGLLN
ncbi:MAG: DUF945 family protein, partial [Enterobacterales bacterium]|nr:DUF945 family protein [Enterobacterales bacterium]